MKVKKFCIIIIIALFCWGCSSFKMEKNDLTEMNLYGNVKFLREYIYNVVINSGEVSKGDRNYSSENKYLFNDKKNNMSWDSYDSNGELYSRCDYKYDENWNPTKVSFYKSDGSLYSEWIFKYDNNGNLIERNYNYSTDRYRHLDDKTTFKYDGRGNLVEENKFNYLGDFSNKMIYKNDKKGNHIKSKYYKSDGSIILHLAFKYDNKNNKLEWISYDSDGNVEYKTKYKYDDLGNVLVENKYDSENKHIDDKTYQYEFDSRSNWIKKTEFKNKIPVLITEREINYYK